MNIEEAVKVMIDQKVAQDTAEIVGEHQRGEHIDPLTNAPYNVALHSCPLCQYERGRRGMYAAWIRDAADDMAVHAEQPTISAQKQARPIISVAVGEVL